MKIFKAMMIGLSLLAFWGCDAHAAFPGSVAVTLPANAHISTLAASGGDYTDPAAWVADRITGKDLVSLDVTEVLQIRAGVYDFTINIPNGSATTDTDHRIIVMAYPGEECTGPTVGARIVWTAADAAEAIQLYNSWCYIYNLGVSKPNGAASPTCGGAWVGSGSGNPAIEGGGIAGVYAWDIRNSVAGAAAIEVESAGAVIDNCHVDGVEAVTIAKGISAVNSDGAVINDSYAGNIAAGTTAKGISAATSDSCVISNSEAYSVVSSSANPADTAAGISVTSGDGVILRNLVTHKATAANGSGIGILSVTTTNLAAYNCTSALNQIGCLTYLANATAVNVASEQNTTLNWYAVSGAWTQTTCTDGAGVSFVDAAGGNFNLLRGDTRALNKGTTIATFSDSFNGIQRPQEGVWDIGAYEYFSPVQIFFFQ